MSFGGFYFWHGFVLIFILISYVIFLINFDRIDDEKEVSKIINFKMVFLKIIFGMIGLSFGATLFVNGAKGIAIYLGVSDLIIGMSIVALGTSLPELAVGVISAIKRKVDFALGNILGSNIYNVLGVLGFSSFFGNFQIPNSLGSQDLYFMLFVTILIFCFMFFVKRIGRIYGSISLVMYVSYIIYIYN